MRVFSLACLLGTVVALNITATAQQTPVFTPGNVVVAVEGCGVQGGTCTNVPNGTGTGTGNSSSTGYGDNQAAPLTLFQFQPSGTASAFYVNSLVLPQAGSGRNLPVSGEYGSSSEGTLQLSGTGQYLTIGTYGINAANFNASPTTYGAAPSLALAQSGSLTGQSYTPVARVATLIDPYGNVNSSTAIFNIFNLNNPRSVYTFNGTSVYLSGQGSGSDATGGVFYAPLFLTNTAPISITGLDTTTNTLSQDTRDVQIYNNTLYVSVDSKGGSGSTRSYLGTLGTPPPTSLYANNAGPAELNLANNAATPLAVTSNGKITLTASEVNSLNTAGSQVNLSPSGYFFANPYTLYIADTGNSKQTSATSLNGDGGLQKWINTKPDGSGTWELMYTLSAGLNLVLNTNAKPTDTTGTSGLYSVTGTVSGSTVSLYAVNATLADLDPTYLYGFTDVLAATTNPGTPFVQLAAAPADSNFKGVAMAPSLPAGSASITSSPSGFSVTTSGTGCAPGTYVTPVTLLWTPGSACLLTTTSPQISGSLQYAFSQWQDGTTSTTDAVIAPAIAATYTVAFTNNQPIASPTHSIYVADASRVQIFTANGTFSSQFAIIGNGRFLFGPAGLAVDPEGDSFLTDTFNKNVSEFDSNGNFVRSFGSFGTGPGQFANGIGSLTVDPNGNVFVADSGNDRIEEFTNNGGYIGQFGTRGHAAGQFVTPTSVATDAAGNIFVADSSRVQEFTPGGQYLQQFPLNTAGRFAFGPGGLAINAGGDLYLTDTAAKDITEFDPNGNILQVFGSFGSGNGAFLNGLGSVAVDANGNLLAADPGNHRIQSFSGTGLYQSQFGTLGNGPGQSADGPLFLVAR